MKILLINPYIYDFTAYDLWLRPMGLLYIASVIKKYTDSEIYWIDTLDRFSVNKNPKSRPDGRGKFEKTVVDKPKIYENVPRFYSRYGMDTEQFDSLLEDLPEMDIILFTSLMTYWIDGLNFTVNKVKRRFPNAKYVLGGIIPTLVGTDFPGSENFDYSVQGYGEEKILNILRSLGCSINSYPDFRNINNIPSPAYELLGTVKYLPILTSRGCPFRCTYCASHLLNKEFLQRDPDLIYTEISEMVEKFDTKHFIIFDDAFLVNKKERFYKVFEKIANRFNLNFHTPNGLHASEIDRKTADILFNSGFKTVRLSFESTDDSLLQMSSGKVKVQEMISAVEQLEKAGFKKDNIESYLLFGIPGQSLKKLEDSIDFVRNLGIKPRLSLFSPVPQTTEYLKLQRSGILSEKSGLYETNKIYFLYEKSGFSPTEIKHIKYLVRDVVLSSGN